MTLVESTPTLYEEALRGEPLARVIFPERLNTHASFWNLGDWRIVLPAPLARPSPGVQRIVRQLREWTGWSARRLAEVVGTSHTTILSVENGRPLVGGHSGDLRDRLTDAHAVIERVHLLAGRDPDMLTRLLETAPPGGTAAIVELEAGEPGRAYLAALEVLRPRTPGLLVGDRPRRSGGSAALHD